MSPLRQIRVARRGGPTFSEAAAEASRDQSECLAAVDAAPEESLANYTSQWSAVAMRDLPSGASMFVSCPEITTDMLRIMAGRAGVHLVIDVDCNVCASGPYIVLHGSQDGPVQVILRQAGTVRDIMTDRTIGRGCTYAAARKRGDLNPPSGDVGREPRATRIRH